MFDSIDGHRFDAFTRTLATGASRRLILKGAFSGALGGAISLIRMGSGLTTDKVIICHNTGSATNPIVQIKVSVAAIPAHEAHGDAINPDFSTDVNNCGGCGIVCDDNDPCTLNLCNGGKCSNPQIDCSAFTDQCNVGVCVGGSCQGKAANEGQQCDDKDACTVDETCQSGACTGGTALSCDDGNPCTDDSCDPATGCAHTVVVGRECSDGDACTAGETCQSDGTCGGGTPLDCDDGNPCTIDSCEGGVCRHEPNCPGQVCNAQGDCESEPPPGCGDDTCGPTEFCCGVHTGPGPECCTEGQFCTFRGCESA